MLQAAVVTGSASLAVSLSLMAGDWEVAFVGDLEELGRGEPYPDVVVLDLGSTDAGIDAAAALGTNGDRPRVVVLGEIPGSGPGVDVVVVRPFTIEDLVAHLHLPRPTEVTTPTSSGRTPSRPSRPPAPVTPAPRLTTSEPDDPPALDDAPQERSDTPRTLDGGSDPDMTLLQDEEDSTADGLAQRTLAFLRRPSQRDAGIDTDPSLEGRLDAGIRSCRFLEAMLDELPSLASPQDVGGAILDEVLDRFEAEVAAVWALGSDRSYTVVAGVRLSAAEFRSAVNAEQPLFRMLADGGHAVLIDPTDMARGILAGVAGTREESLLAASLLADGELVGAVTIGGVSFAPKDADRLQEIAAEASLALGLAVRLSQLRRAVGSPAYRHVDPGY